MCEITRIYQKLRWENTEETQMEGVLLAQEIKNLSLLIQPPAPPSVWEQCANILYKKNDNELEPYLIMLLEWLQDLNDPGALIILERLKRFDGAKLCQPFVECCIAAEKMNPTLKEQWLSYLSELLDNEQLRSFLPNELLRKLAQTNY